MTAGKMQNNVEEKKKKKIEKWENQDRPQQIFFIILLFHSIRPSYLKIFAYFVVL